MKTKTSFLSAIIIVFLMSCQNDEITSLQSQGCENMLYFETIDDCVSELNKVFEMNEEDREVWEVSKGFKSLGLESERFYASVKPEDFKSVEEVKQFVKKNSNFLQLVEDNAGGYELDVIFSDNPYRFFANSDCLFQVNNKICKVYKDAVVSVDENKIDELKNADFNTAVSIENSSLLTSSNNSYYKSESIDCVSSTFRSDSGDERIRLKIGKWADISYPYLACAYFEARPYHQGFLGIWYYCTRDVSVDINIGVTYLNSNNIWSDNHAYCVGTIENTKVIEKYLPVGYCNNSSQIGLHSYDSWAQQEYTNQAKAYCE